MRPRVLRFVVPVREAAPQAVAIARGLGWLTGKDINASPGSNGAIRYGWPSIQTQRTAYKGYVNPPQIFTGYDPAKVAAGLIRPDPASLPGDSMTAATLDSPLVRAMRNVTLGQQIATG